MTDEQAGTPPWTGGPLAGLRVIDAGVLFAGPVIATLLADFGADVIKIEHPRGDALRTLGWKKEDVSLWWAFVNRNKRLVSIDFSKPEGAQLLRDLASTADVLIESYRPGTLERWGCGPDVLREINPRLVIVRTSGFGQTGPYSPRPGFGTVAESISGFAHINGHPDGPPTLPPFALGDGVASLFGTFATMFALYHRDQHAAPGQVIDLADLRAALLAARTAGTRLRPARLRPGPDREQHGMDRAAQRLPVVRRALARARRPVPSRSRSGSCAWSATRNSSTSRGSPTTPAGSSTRRSSIGVIGAWIADHTSAEVQAAFEEQEAVIGPIYSIADIFEDPQYIARETITTVDDPILGPAKVQNAIPRLVDTPGKVRHLGGWLGQDNDSILGGELGHSAEELARWEAAGVIGRGMPPPDRRTGSAAPKDEAAVKVD